MPSVWLLSGNPTVLEFPEHATHGSFLDGDLVKLASTGQVQLATAAGPILGIARKKYTGTENTKIPVELLDPNGLYVVAYTASATAQALVGDCVDFVMTAGAQYVTESGATTDAYCVGFYDAVGTTSGRLIVRFFGTLFTAAF